MDKQKNRSIEILDCTLRDGSYAIDYQFTAEDTAVICGALEGAGFKLIEIGHGLGLNASGPDHGIAAASDEEYLAAAASALSKAQFGMFCIPGVARVQDLDIAAKYKMGFVRIGTNVTEAATAEPFIKRAKDLGMSVSANLMKSYAVDLPDFVSIVEQVVAYGVDTVCVVDSAGGMLPQDVRAFVGAARAAVPAKIGYHGHNNLLLAVANSLEAIDSGADIIDTSMQGMGRSAGNAQTEIMIILLEKLGYRTGIDLFHAMDIGERLVKPMMGGLSGIDSISATLGHAQFHSSYLKVIYRVAQKYGLDPRELIVRVSEVDKIRVTEELAEDVAADIERETKSAARRELVWNVNLDFKEVFEKHGGAETGPIARDIALEMMALSKKTGKPTVFTLALTRDKLRKETVFPFLRQNKTYVIGNAEAANLSQAKTVATAIDGLVDVVLIDLALCGQGLEETLKKSKFISYRDDDALIRAVDAIVDRLAGDLRGKRVLILGELNRGAKLALNLAERGARIKLVVDSDQREVIQSALTAITGGAIECATDVTAGDTADVLVAVGPDGETVDETILGFLPDKALVVDAGPGCIQGSAVPYALSKGLDLLRIDMRAGLAGEIVNVLETDELIERIMGRREIAGVTVVAGGVIGTYGDIVVDCASEPTRVIGVADGRGQLLGVDDTSSFANEIRRVRRALARREIKPLLDTTDTIQ